MADPHGLLLIDKPRGKTSHDVVAEVRRALSTKHVGHAGTLDPMATGLLVVLVGDATRLATFLTDEDKSYSATLKLGVGTSTLDADGEITESAPLCDDLRDELRASSGQRLAAAIAHELAWTEQVPPVVSAIHVDGERAYARARRGEVVEMAPRQVRLQELRVTASDADLGTLSVEVSCAKGYYVRALARDLGASLGVPAHLIELRRLSSGGFRIDEAIPLAPREALPAALRSTTFAMSRAMPLVELTEDGALRARQGKQLDETSFVGDMPTSTSGWIYKDAAVAVGDAFGRVVRGFPSG